tara:strand:+ start:7 stop:162 length:156 start_codon:yes stop_codon:yes gene_type:complete
MKSKKGQSGIRNYTSIVLFYFCKNNLEEHKHPDCVTENKQKGKPLTFIEYK